MTRAVGSDWKWGIGMWALPLSCIPLAYALEVAQECQTTTEKRIKDFEDDVMGEIGLLLRLDAPGLVCMTFS